MSLQTLRYKIFSLIQTEWLFLHTIFVSSSSSSCLFSKNTKHKQSQPNQYSTFKRLPEKH